MKLEVLRRLSERRTGAESAEGAEGAEQRRMLAYSRLGLAVAQFLALALSILVLIQWPIRSSALGRRPQLSSSLSASAHGLLRSSVYQGLSSSALVLLFFPARFSAKGLKDEVTILSREPRTKDPSIRAQNPEP